MKFKETWEKVKKFFTKEVTSEIIDLGPLADCEIEVLSNGLMNFNEIRDGGQTVVWITNVPIDYFVDHMNFVRTKFSEFIIFMNQQGEFTVTVEDSRKILPNIKIYTRLDSQIAFAFVKDGKKELVRAQYVMGMSTKMINIIAKIKEAQMRLSGW